MAARDRGVLVLRYLEHLSTAETAAVLGISDGAVKLRHLRALERFRAMVGSPEEGHLRQPGGHPERWQVPGG
jgi:DNA-directed RNA polymerase specialized sigma24 family protein